MEYNIIEYYKMNLFEIDSYVKL